MPHLPEPLAFLRDAPLALDHLGLISVAGPDAGEFLQAQLTGGVTNLAAGRARLTGYCSAKGRLLAVMTLWGGVAQYWLLVPRELTAPLVKRLAMFVLRSTVKITDASAAHRLSDHVSTVGGALPASTLTEPFTWAEHEGVTLLRVPDAQGLQRWFAIRAAAAPAGNDAGLPLLDAANDALLEPPRAPEHDAAALWRWLDLRAGIPVVYAATQERFVPQMINLEALDGVDFRKGCYPGQEVVARSQYLGRLKRRMSGAHLDAADPLPAAGTDVLASPGGEAQGSVVCAERSPLGGIDLLLELPLAAMTERVTLAGTGDLLTLWPVPYELPENEVFVRPKL